MPDARVAEKVESVAKGSCHTIPPSPSVTRVYWLEIGKYVIGSIANRLRKIGEVPLAANGSILSLLQGI